MIPQSSEKLFISHSSQDAAWCRPFVAALRGAGHTCFYDEDSIPGTTAWVRMIEQGVGECDYFILVLTPVALASRWVKEEVELAFVKNKRILVVVHEPAQPDGLLLTRQWVQAAGLAPSDAANKVLHTLPVANTLAAAIPQTPVRQTPVQQSTWEEIAIPARLDRLGFAGWRDRKTGISFIIPPVCPVAAGKFTMGSDPSDPQASDDEKGQYSIPVGAFEVGTFPVTVAEYALAVQAGAVPAPPGKDDERYGWKQQQEHPDHPVVCVTWENARDYCRWLAQVTGQPWRLPTEAEWEKAARWDAARNHARVYPWGDQWDKTRANTRDGGPGMTTPVGQYMDKDTSPYGCHDMAGNVWEWTSTLWHARPPYDATKYENESDRTSFRVLRGGSWYDVPRVARAAYRLRYLWYVNWGFRVARSRAGW